jgi:hypothetical protein
VPGVSGYRNGNSVTTFAADNVKLAADAADGLVENDIVLKRVGP